MYNGSGEALEELMSRRVEAVLYRFDQSIQEIAHSILYSQHRLRLTIKDNCSSAWHISGRLRQLKQMLDRI